MIKKILNSMVERGTASVTCLAQARTEHYVLRQGSIRNTQIYWESNHLISTTLIQMKSPSESKSA